MKIHHENGTTCLKCDEFLKLSHPEMAKWFREKKAKYIGLHVSCSWRSAYDQNLAYSQGLSDLVWPKSRHNYTDKYGNPMSEALDLFVISEEGQATFPVAFYQALKKECEDNHEPVIGCIRLKSGKLDAPHFQLIKSPG